MTSSSGRERLTYLKPFSRQESLMVSKILRMRIDTMLTIGFTDWVKLKGADGQQRGEVYLEMTFYSSVIRHGPKAPHLIVHASRSCRNRRSNGGRQNSFRAKDQRSRSQYPQDRNNNYRLTIHYSELTFWKEKDFFQSMKESVLEESDSLIEARNQDLNGISTRMLLIKNSKCNFFKRILIIPYHQSSITLSLS